MSHDELLAQHAASYKTLRDFATTAVSQGDLYLGFHYLRVAFNSPDCPFGPRIKWDSLQELVRIARGTCRLPVLRTRVIDGRGRSEADKAEADLAIERDRALPKDKGEIIAYVSEEQEFDRIRLKRRAAQLKRVMRIVNDVVRESPNMLPEDLLEKLESVFRKSMWRGDVRRWSGSPYT